MQATSIERPACASFPDLFFSTLAPNIALAKATCVLECPFRAECLRAALADPDPQGVMAGLEPATIAKLRKDPAKAAQVLADLEASSLTEVA